MQRWNVDDSVCFHIFPYDETDSCQEIFLRKELRQMADTAISALNLKSVNQISWVVKDIDKTIEAWSFHLWNGALGNRRIQSGG